MGLMGPDPLVSAGLAPEAGRQPGSTATGLEIAGVIGLQLSDPLADMQRIVHDLISTGKISRSQVQMLSTSIEVARRIAMQGQQLARLSRGKLRQSHERIGLDTILRQALAERSSFFQQKRIVVTQEITRVEVVVDPGILTSLVDTAIDWIGDHDQSLTVRLDHASADPTRALLLLRATATGRNGAVDRTLATVDGEGVERLGWHLLLTLARTMGASVSRETQGSQVDLLIEFPRTVRQLEGLAAVDTEQMGGDSWLASETRSVSGLQIMLVTNDPELAVDVSAICQNMGLLVTQAASSQMAERLCETGHPHLIVVDERAIDQRFEAMLSALLASNPRFPSIEIARDANSLSMTSWMGDVTTRISLDSVRAQLPQVLTLELAKAG